MLTHSIYQIYPRSFYDANGDGMGDINGIIQKLDYISDLGFETIWISPFFASPQRDFGYDISDYFSIAPEYGTMRDAEQLIDEVHQRGMKIMFDMVLNHTSDEHAWFRESASSRDNAKADWYIWRDKPNNWKSIIGPSGWHYCDSRKQYYYASFLPFQPDLNYHNKEVKQQMWEVCRFWLSKGVDGFRLDIFNCIIKDKQFRDNPFSLFHIIPSEEYPGGNFQLRKYSVNQPENFELAKELRKVADEFSPPRILLGEVFGTQETISRYLGNNDGLHLIFSFDILFFKFKASFFKNILLQYEQNFPHPKMPTVVFSNHDQWRSQRRLNNDLEKAKLIAVLQMTIRAVPVIYYGEEIGMTNASIPLKQAKDSLAKTYSLLPDFLVNMLPVAINRDNCRTPMQWNNGKHAGFSSAEKIWLPVNANYTERNVASMQTDKDSLLSVYKKLLFLRKNENALLLGNMSRLDILDKSILVYERTHEKERMKIYLNFSRKKKKIPKFSTGENICLLIGEVVHEHDRICMGKYAALIVKY